jgi:hypothetical protein
MEVFDYSLNELDFKEARVILAAACELLCTAVEANLELLVKTLSEQFAECLENMRSEDEDVTARLVGSIRERFDEDNLTPGEKRAIASSVGLVLTVSHGYLGQFVEETWRPILRYIDRIQSRTVG